MPVGDLYQDILEVCLGIYAVELRVRLESQTERASRRVSSSTDAA
jgi:hypothetical protein